MERSVLESSLSLKIFGKVFSINILNYRPNYHTRFNLLYNPSTYRQRKLIIFYNVLTNWMMNISPEIAL